MLLYKENSQFSAVVSVLLTLLALAFITYQGIIATKNTESYWLFNHGKEKPFDKSSNDIFTEDYNHSVEKAVLNISGGAAHYILKDTTEKLFDAKIPGKDVEKNFWVKTIDDSIQIVDFKLRGDSNWNLNDDNHKPSVFKLNSKPVWDINFKVGAGIADLDLTSFKINKLSIKGGAAAFEIKLAKPYQNTDVSVETGISKIEISVPGDAACKIYSKSGLSSTDFDGFTKQSDGTYTSKSYTDSSKAIIINLKGGLSNFEVKQY